MPLQGDPRDWSADTRQGAIFRAMAATPDRGHQPGRGKCAVCAVTYAKLVPTLGEWPLVFRRDGRELPRGTERARRLRNLIAEIHAYGADFRPEEAPSEPSEPTPEAPKAEPKTGAVPADVERYLRELERLRKFADERGFDSLESMRADIDGAKLVAAGLPVEGVLWSITATWSDDSRRQAGLKPFDYAAFKAPSDGSHAVSEYVATAVDAGVYLWLHGPAGTGKSSAARYAAERAGLPYREVNLAGAMVSAIKGKDRLKEFIESEFTRAYRDGAVLCLEEFDAAHPTVATAVNNAIANGHFFNDADGQVHKRHRNFRLIATGNTVGTGATKEFTGRMKIDAATRDRFRAGMVYVGRDNALARRAVEALFA